MIALPHTFLRICLALGPAYPNVLWVEVVCYLWKSFKSQCVVLHISLPQWSWKCLLGRSLSKPASLGEYEGQCPSAILGWTCSTPEESTPVTSARCNVGILAASV